jgi:hypothetical protein
MGGLELGSAALATGDLIVVILETTTTALLHGVFSSLESSRME